MMTVALIVAGVALLMFLTTRMSGKGVAHISPIAAREMVKSADVFKLDVRSAQEFSGGHIQGATNIPLGEIASRMTELSSLKNSQVLVYCRSGARSGAASQMLKKHGFVKLTNLQGGTMAWSAGGFPLVKGSR